MLSQLICNFNVYANPIESVKKHNLLAYTWEDEEWPNEGFGDYLNRCMEYQKELQPFKKCRAAWNILERYYKHGDVLTNHVIGNDRLTWQNLQLLHGEGDSELYLANCIDRTSTEIGRVILRAWIAQPTDDCIELRKRQSCAQYLVEHEELFKQLDRLLLEFKASENLFLSFWLHDPLQGAAQRHYFKLSTFPNIENYCNENTKILTLSSLLDHKKRILSFAMTSVATAILPLCALSRLGMESKDSWIDNLSERLVGVGGPVFGAITLVPNNIVQAGGFLAAGFYCGVRMQDEYEWTRDNFTLSMCLQTKLHHVANCLRVIDSIGNLLVQHPDFLFQQDETITDLLQEFKGLHASAQKLMDLLESDTFKNDATLVSNWGEILVAYRLMHQHIHDMEGFLCAFGQLDAYMSIARLYKEFEHSRVNYAFVSYVEDAKNPTISFKDLWSPFIDPVKVVVNSIELGGALGFRNFIITGPNEGGKSTFVRSVAINLILAQSIGIVPASYAQITPFSYISTYLNITDEHGKSLFEAQVERIKHILDHIDSMQDGQYSFVIVDELFNGTDARVGQAASYSIADYLCKNPNVISIFPTHFPELTNLENNGNSVNYKVSATIDTSGRISYPFLVEQGASKQSVVFDIMRTEGFNSLIINNAVQRLEH
jgi:DNA mismatch repair protein MutS